MQEGTWVSRCGSIVMVCDIFDCTPGAKSRSLPSEGEGVGDGQPDEQTARQANRHTETYQETDVQTHIRDRHAVRLRNRRTVSDGQTYREAARETER